MPRGRLRSEPADGLIHRRNSDLSVQIDAPIEVVPTAAPDDSVAAVSAAVETVAITRAPLLFAS